VLVDPPKEAKIISCKWVYRIKRNSDGSVEKFKARLVVRGFTQNHGIDYLETFSPVARLSTVTSLIAVAANEKMNIFQFDVCSAFLYGSVTECIYMEQPLGFSDGSNKVCKLNHSLYGLKQSPRCWNITFTEAMLEFGFVSSEADPCLFIKIFKDFKMYVCLYVDDGLLVCDSKSEAEKFLSQLRLKFKITCKPANFYLGLEIKIENDSVTVCQSGYTRRILERFRMASCKPVGSPMLKHDPSQNGLEPEHEECVFPYREAVGAHVLLIPFLLLGSLLDIPSYSFVKTLKGLGSHLLRRSVRVVRSRGRWIIG